jgi:hypothetical protein
LTWPAVVFWVVILAGAISRGPALLYLFSIAGAFGTLQMLPGEVVGGANVLPQSICAVFLVGKVFLQRGNLLRGAAAAVDPRRLGLLAAFLVYAIPTALILPRLFANQVEVVAVGAAIAGASILQPTFNNITQTGYMALSIATALAFAILGSREDFRRHYLLSVLLGGLALIVTGLVDMATYTTGTSALLEPFRNATYALLVDAEALGSKRVVGLTSEASSFGSLCVGSLALLAFLRPCFGPRLRRTLVPLTIGGLFVMAVISTSSSAYIGLAIFAAAFGVNWLIRLGAIDAPAREGLRSELAIVVAGAFLILCVVVMMPQLLDPVRDMFDAVILKKSASASYVERNTWTRVGWEAFVATQGLGVGLGGLRTSNWFVSILGSTGLFGGLLMFGFMARVFFARTRLRSAQAREWRRGLRCSLVPSLVISWFSGTIPDIGVTAGALYGLLVALDGASTERTIVGAARTSPLQPPHEPVGSVGEGRPRGSRGGRAGVAA